MTINVAINGAGRIGKNVLRAVFESNRGEEFNIVALNDPIFEGKTPDQIAGYLSRDTIHGHFSCEIQAADDQIFIDGQIIKLLAEREPANLPWGELGVDITMECTGKFKELTTASQHIDTAGAMGVLVSAPGKGMKNIVYGVNHDTITSEDTVLSNASCTTNCLAPIASALLKSGINIDSGIMTTVHSYTSDQSTLDSLKDPLRGRAAAGNIVPTSTGAATAIRHVIPELEGKLIGDSYRVPTMDGSAVHLVITPSSFVSAEDINQAVMEAADGDLAGILGCTDEPLVSSDIIGNPLSSIFMLGATENQGSMVRLASWYDNEWAFSNRMLDTAKTQYDALTQDAS